jgi:hypothetical protein
MIESRDNNFEKRTYFILGYTKCPYEIIFWYEKTRQKALGIKKILKRIW